MHPMPLTESLPPASLFHPTSPRVVRCSRKSDLHRLETPGCVCFAMQSPLSWFVLLVLWIGSEVNAQRPSNLSICDYYAESRYGANNVTTQFRLMQSIVALAFGGGRGVDGTEPDSTGILNPGRFDGQDVNLRSWFDGTSTVTRERALRDAEFMPC